MSDAQRDQLRRHLKVIHEEFERLYGVLAPEPFAIEIEFKITSDDVLAIKQARPWVFGETATRPNSPATGLPTIWGLPEVDETLTADTSGIADADGLTNPAFSYRWTSTDGLTNTDTQNATDATYRITGDLAGKNVTLTVSLIDHAGNAETLTSEPTTQVHDAGASPAWTATLTVGTNGTNAGYDIFTGLGSLSPTAFWLEPTLAHAVGSIYDDEIGRLTLVVSRPLPTVFTLSVAGTEFDAQGAETAENLSGSIYSWPKGELTWTPGEEMAVSLVIPESPADAGPADTPAPEPAANNPATGAPTIGGTPQVEQTLTANRSSITDQDGLTNVSYRYQWIAGGSDIAGATGSTYTLTASEQGQTVQVRVTFTDDADNEETLTSEATVAVAAAPNREATGTPSIGGTPQVDQTLTADTANIVDQDGLTGVSYSYQWIAGGSDIYGATGSSYQLTSTEQGQTIQVRVTFTDDRNNSESLTSVATGAVANKPVPLTATFSNVPTSHSGSGEFTFDLAFSENLPLSYQNLRDHAFTEDDDGPATKAKRKVQGSNQTWTITVEPSGNGAITITRPATTDCTAAGAICTSDARKLSNSTTITIPGSQ